MLRESIDLWSLPLDANRGRVTGELQRLTRDEAADNSPSISADGRLLAFSSNRSGVYMIWSKDLVSGKEALLTTGAFADTFPVISPDGSKVVYGSETDQVNYLLKIGSADLSQPRVPRKITDGRGRAYSWSADGERLFYAVKSDLWRVNALDVGSGRDYSVFRREPFETFLTQPSPDDRWLVFLVTLDGKARVHVAPFREGTMIGSGDWFPLTAGAAWEDRPSWSPDGSLVYYTSDRDGFRCIWAQRLTPEVKRPVGPEIEVYHSHSARLSLRNLRAVDMGVTVARDKVVFNMGEATGNIWMAELAGR